MSLTPNYGIDAPEVVLRFFVLGIIGVILWLGSILALKTGFLHWAGFIERPGLWMGCSFLGTAGVMLWGSKKGKLRLRNRVVNEIPWRGDELVLDVGCGHGLLLIAAAKRLRSGKAIGIDLWQQEDQAGNSREATWQNVQLENVAAQVELRDGDARKLPFADHTFDVVVSSWALHNIYDHGGREMAVREIVRALKPGGRVAIIDIRHTNEYARVLRTAQLLNVRRSWPNFLFVIPTFTVTATKPI
jgi:arsenite methyltransferase